MVVGEHDGGADEDPGLELGGLVDERVVLDLAVVAQRDAGADVRAAPHDAVAAEDGVLADLREVPDRGSLADDGPLVDVGAGHDARGQQVSSGARGRVRGMPWTPGNESTGRGRRGRPTTRDLRLARRIPRVALPRRSEAVRPGRYPAPVSRRPHLLYVAWGYPPCRAGGVYRALATPNAFAAAGWDVTVLTVHRETFHRYTGADDALEELIDPRITVVRPRSSLSVVMLSFGLLRTR